VRRRSEKESSVWNEGKELALYADGQRTDAIKLGKRGQNYETKRAIHIMPGKKKIGNVPLCEAYIAPDAQSYNRARKGRLTGKTTRISKKQQAKRELSLQGLAVLRAGDRGAVAQPWGRKKRESAHCSKWVGHVKVMSE